MKETPRQGQLQSMEMPPDSMWRPFTRAAHVLDVLLRSGRSSPRLCRMFSSRCRRAPGLGAVGDGRVVRAVEEQREHHHRHGDEDEQSRRSGVGRCSRTSGGAPVWLDGPVCHRSWWPTPGEGRPPDREAAAVRSSWVGPGGLLSSGTHHSVKRVHWVMYMSAKRRHATNGVVVHATDLGPADDRRCRSNRSLTAG